MAGRERGAPGTSAGKVVAAGAWAGHQALAGAVPAPGERPRDIGAVQPHPDVAAAADAVDPDQRVAAGAAAATAEPDGSHRRAFSGVADGDETVTPAQIARKTQPGSVSPRGRVAVPAAGVGEGGAPGLHR